MTDIHNLITDNIDVWTSAIKKRYATGRGSNKKIELTGVKKLRELILELAVRGKLVSQDVNDEPASVLLDKIAEEKAQLIADKKIKKQKTLPEVTDEEKPFDLPYGWKWLRLAESYYPISPSGKKLKGKEIEEVGEYPVVDQGQTFIAGYTNLKELLIHIPQPVIVFGDHTTNIKYIDFNFVAGADGTKILCPILLFPRYFYTYLLNYDLENRGYARHFKVLNDNLIAIPPLAEQHRIVAKVDELMALCDQLEQQTENSITPHQTLVEELLNALFKLTDFTPTDIANTAQGFPQENVQYKASNNVKADAQKTVKSDVKSEVQNERQHKLQNQQQNDFEANWQRIADHFDDLFSTEASIDQLKQTILQLAVMGKLVPQNPNDEPASVLLEKIAEEKMQLIADKKIKKQKPLAEISDEEKPFELPHNWKWCRVWDVAKIITSGSRDWAKHYSDKGAIFVTMGNLSRGNYRLRLDTLRYVNPPAGGEGSRTKLEESDLLLSITGDVGNLGLIPKGFGDAYINQHTCLLRFMPDCQNRYFPELMRSPLAKFQFDAPQRGIKNSFRLGDVGEMLVPIPPLAEQHRIVAKVDELMTLCDQLKTRLADAQITQLHLADAVVENALSNQVVS
jgi:type I restriction enzyme S subunit